MLGQNRTLMQIRELRERLTGKVQSKIAQGIKRQEQCCLDKLMSLLSRVGCYSKNDEIYKQMTECLILSIFSLL